VNLNPLGYVDQNYLKTAADLLHPIKLRTYEQMQISAGARLLDVGCGSGADTIPLAEKVGAGGRVVGVDNDRNMIVRAASAARGTNAQTQVIHICAEATRLPLRSNYFQASRSERLFQHLPSPELVLGEMVRVTQPGGRVVVLDTDHGTWSVDTSERDIERRITRFKTEYFGHNGYAGRQLYRLFRQADLEDVTCEMISGYFTDYALVRLLFMLDEVEPAAVKAGVISPDELGRWRASLSSAAASGSFFCSESMVLAAGRKKGGR
jgi:ubiquinone/menaquinone biosynthesis C-methylase UbiE